MVDRYSAPTDLVVQLAGVTAGSLYVSYVDGKNAQPADVATMEARNRETSLNFEQSATWSLGGHAQAAADAPYTMGRAAVLGVHSVALIASHDYPWLASRWPFTLDYQTRWAQLVRARGFWSGAYGDFTTISRLFAAGVIDVGWQTSAWSGADVCPLAQLYQHVYTEGYDLSDIRGNFRGWSKAGPMFNPSAPKPVLTATNPASLIRKDDKMILLGYGQKSPGPHLINYQDGKGWRPIRVALTEANAVKAGALKMSMGEADFVVACAEAGVKP